MAINIPLGSQAPAALSTTITPYGPTLDMTTVTAVVFQVYRQTDGVTVTWNATISGTPTVSSLVANYEFASGGGDFPVLGPYAATPILTVPGGSVVGTVVELVCVPPSRFLYPITPTGQ